MFATTKLVRKIVRSLHNDFGYTYTDENKRVKNLRYVTFEMYSTRKAKAVKNELEVLLKLLGYKNTVKVTTSKERERYSGGRTYLRINNCVLEK